MILMSDWFCVSYFIERKKNFYPVFNKVMVMKVSDNFHILMTSTWQTVSNMASTISFDIRNHWKNIRPGDVFEGTFILN